MIAIILYRFQGTHVRSEAQSFIHFKAQSTLWLLYTHYVHMKHLEESSQLQTYTVCVHPDFSNHAQCTSSSHFNQYLHYTVSSTRCQLHRAFVSQSEEKQRRQNKKNNKLLNTTKTTDVRVDKCQCESIIRYPLV